MANHVFMKGLLDPVEAHAANVVGRTAKTTVKGPSTTALHSKGFRG